ncbi:MAG: hypothetical protein ACLF0G_10980 [Candidatus Brocadiia bacterium]
MSARRLLAGALAALALLPAAAGASGLLFRYQGPDGVLRPATGQFWVAVHHREGEQRMLLAALPAVDRGESVLWLVPVPAAPREVDVEAADAFPLFRRGVAAPRGGAPIERFMAAVRATQLYPLFFDGLYLAISTSRRQAPQPLSLVPHRWASAQGVSAEAVAADSPTLISRINSDFAPLERTERWSLRHFRVEGATLVLVAIGPSGAAASGEAQEAPESARRGPRERVTCVHLRFPAERPVYPLEPAVGYGNVKTSARLFVLGHVAAEPYHELGGSPPEAAEAEPQPEGPAERDLEPRHYVQPDFADGIPAAFAAGLPERDIPFTDLSALHSPGWFASDYTFVPVEPAGAERPAAARAVFASWWAVPLWLGCVAALSALASGLAGLVRRRKWRHYARLGLWNLLTVVAYGLAIHRRFRRRLRAERHDLTPGEAWMVATKFLAAFTAIYVLASLVLQLVLSLLF